MFGIFKRRAAGVSGAKKSELADLVVDLLQVQQAMAGSITDDTLHGEESIGYVFGFADGFAQRAQMDETEGLGFITVVFVRLFGVTRGAELVGNALSIQQTSEEFAAARQAGGAEALTFLTRGSDAEQRGWFVILS